MGRTSAGVSDSAAQEALDAQLSGIVRATIPLRAGEDIPRLVLRDGSRGLFGQKEFFATPMSVLMMFVGLVLLLACANIANLMLARGAQRQREMSVRLALGAGHTRILRQMLVESLLLALIGGVSGLAIGYWGRAAIPRLAGNAWELATFPVHFDWQVFAFTAAVTILTGVLFGLAPALAATRADVANGLKEGGQNGNAGAKGLRRQGGGRISDRALHTAGHRRRTVCSLAGRAQRRRPWIPHRPSAACPNRSPAGSLRRRRECRVSSAPGAGDRDSFREWSPFPPESIRISLTIYRVWNFGPKAKRTIRANIRPKPTTQWACTFSKLLESR